MKYANTADKFYPLRNMQYVRKHDADIQGCSFLTELETSQDVWPIDWDLAEVPVLTDALLQRGDYADPEQPWSVEKFASLMFNGIGRLQLGVVVSGKWAGEWCYRIEFDADHIQRMRHLGLGQDITQIESSSWADWMILTNVQLTVLINEASRDKCRNALAAYHWYALSLRSPVYDV